MLIYSEVIIMFSTKQDVPKYIYMWWTRQHILILWWTTCGSCQVGDIPTKLWSCNSTILHMHLICRQLYLINLIPRLWAIRWAPWWIRKEHTCLIQLIKVEHLMCIIWEGSYKETSWKMQRRFINSYCEFAIKWNLHSQKKELISLTNSHSSKPWRFWVLQHFDL